MLKLNSWLLAALSRAIVETRPRWRWIAYPLVAFLLAAGQATHVRADFTLGEAANYGILYEGNGGQQLQYNNSNISGNIGIGTGVLGITGQFQGNGPGTINGVIAFAAGNTGQFSNSGLTLVPSVGNPIYNFSDVTTALNTANSLSQTLGLETGPSTSITSGGSINASNGHLVGGNEIFTVTSISFPNGMFTVNGTASQFVVLNIAGSVGNNGLNGSIQLSGGITSDQVLINYTPSTSNLTTYNNDYASLTGGPTMTVSLNAATSSGTFLDPTGNIQFNHGTIDGRLIGGDTQNFSFVSGANLNEAGGPNPFVTPEPPAILLLAIGAAGLVLGSSFARKRRAMAQA